MQSETLRELASLLAEQNRRQSRTRLNRYKPYAKQREFHAKGLVKRERLLMAGNQLGKSYCGAAEAAMHLTGQYPLDWNGRRFTKPIRMWAGSKTGEMTRDIIQKLLVGEPKDKTQWGSGLIPGDAISDWSLSHGVADAIDGLMVKHITGGTSTVGFKSYVQGREKWQGETLDIVWFDEEPPMDIYMEGLTRTNATGGLVFMTFTPLLGMSEVVSMFIDDCGLDGAMESAGRSITRMTIDDAEHYTDEQRAAIIASYPAHERDARIKGIPALGSGRVFPIPEDDILCEPFEVPKHWSRIGAMDFGWDHPFAAVELAWDRDSDVVYVTKTYRARETTPLVQAAALKPWGAKLPWAWPHDGMQHDKGSGTRLADQYREQGLELLHEKATFEDGSNGVEAGIMEMLDRMQTGRWKVFSHLNDYREEFRLYHRDKGLIVKLRDDLLSASRYGMMMLRYATIERKQQRDRYSDASYASSGGWMSA